MCWCLTLTCVELPLYLQSEVSVLCRIGVRKESGFVSDSNFTASKKESKSIWKGRVNLQTGEVKKTNGKITSKNPNKL
jgi:hypothetical protein